MTKTPKATASFKVEKRAFDRLKTDCPASAKSEYEQAIKTLLELYNTTIYENRFVAGGAVEVFTCALLRSAGVDCMPYGAQERDGDILLPNNRQLSVKGSFQGGIQTVKLINQMGVGNRKWTTATIFVVSEVGLIFGAPDMVGTEHVRSTGDGKVLHQKGLRFLASNSANVMEMDIARKPPTEATAHSRKASTAVAQSILQETNAITLLKTFKP